MYPDTDLPPIVLEDSTLKKIKEELKSPWEEKKIYESMGLCGMKAWRILLASGEERSAFDKLSERFGAPFAYHMVFEARKGMLRKGKSVPLDEIVKIAEKSDKKGLKSWLYSL